ncbi:MAG: tyrosine-type recombinase/integrase, partial [Enterobacteriaceae bacterium]
MRNTNGTELWESLLQEYFFAKPLRSATIESYRKVVKVFREFIGEKKRPDEIDRSTIFSWRQKLIEERSLSAHTWNNKVTHMRALYNFWIKRKMITCKDNPFHEVSLRTHRKQKKVLSKMQMTKLYLKMQQVRETERPELKYDERNALTPAWYWITVLDTFRYTGMRLNQLNHVRLMDVNLDEYYIELRQAGSKTHREWRVPIVPYLHAQLT